MGIVSENAMRASSTYRHTANTKHKIAANGSANTKTPNWLPMGQQKDFAHVPLAANGSAKDSFLENGDLCKTFAPCAASSAYTAHVDPDPSINGGPKHVLQGAPFPKDECFHVQSTCSYKKPV